MHWIGKENPNNTYVCVHTKTIQRWTRVSSMQTNVTTFELLHIDVVALAVPTTHSHGRLSPKKMKKKKKMREKNFNVDLLLLFVNN